MLSFPSIPALFLFLRSGAHGPKFNRRAAKQQTPAYHFGRPILRAVAKSGTLAVLGCDEVTKASNVYHDGLSWIMPTGMCDLHSPSAGNLQRAHPLGSIAVVVEPSPDLGAAVRDLSARTSHYDTAIHTTITEVPYLLYNAITLGCPCVFAKEMGGIPASSQHCHPSLDKW